MEPGAGAEAGQAQSMQSKGSRLGAGGDCQERPSLGLSPQKYVLLPCGPEQGELEQSWPHDLQPPPLPRQHEDRQQDKSTGDDGPATEPLSKVLDTPLSEGDEPTTLPAQLDHGHSVQMEGYLGRKHDLEGPNKKASNRCVGRGCAQGSYTSRALVTWKSSGAPQVSWGVPGIVGKDCLGSVTGRATHTSLNLHFPICKMRTMTTVGLGHAGCVPGTR